MTLVAEDLAQLMQSSVEAANAEIKTLITPVYNVKGYGAKGDGVTDDTTAIQAAITAAGAVGGGIVFFPYGTYLVSDDLTVSYNKIVLMGVSGDASTIKVVNNATGIAHAPIFITGDYVTVDSLGIDGNIDNNSTLVISGIYNESTTGLTIKDCKIKDCIFNGITLFASTFANGPNQDFSIHNNHIENIGWAGIYAYFPVHGEIKDNRIITTGYTAIQIIYILGEGSTTYPRDIEISGNYVNRSTSPTFVLTGNVESGFMIGIGAGDKRISVHHNILYDNLTAGDDGIGLAQDGVLLNEDIVISDNIISYAGQFGIDGTNGCIITNNTISYPAVNGIRISTDLGGDASNIIIDGNLIYNANGDYGIFCSNDSGIAGSNFNNVKINNNTVVDDRVGAAQKTLYAFGISFTDLTVADMEVRGNNFKNVKTDSVIFLSGTSASVKFSNNILKTETSFGALPSARAYHDANQSIDNTTATTLAFNSERFDTDTIHDLVTNNSRLTCNKAGIYLISANVQWASGAGSIRILTIVLNGTTLIAAASNFVSGAAVVTQSVSTVYSLSATDYIEVQGYQDSGGALNVLATGNYSPEFMMTKVE